MAELAIAIRNAVDDAAMQKAARDLSLENTRYLQLDRLAEIASGVADLLEGWIPARDSPDRQRIRPDDRCLAGRLTRSVAMTLVVMVRMTRWRSTISFFSICPASRRHRNWSP
jgi:hypothetical protein